MPVLPTADALGAPPIPGGAIGSPGLNGAGVAARSAAGMWKDIGGTFAGAQEAQVRILDQQDQVAEAEGVSQFYRTKVQLDQDIEKNPDYTQWAPTYQKTLQGVAQQQAATIRNPARRADFMSNLDFHISRATDQVFGRARAKEVDQGQAWLDGTLQSNLDAALRAPDEQTRAGLVTASQAAIDAARDKGYIGAEDAVKQKRTFAEAYAKARLEALGPDDILRETDPAVGHAPPAAGAPPAAPGAPAALPAGSAPGLGPAIQAAADKYGASADGLARTAIIESGGRSGIPSPTGARGPFQFVGGTAKQYGLTNPDDPAASADAAARLWVDNRTRLTEALHRDPSDAEVYLAHQQGAAGATALLQNPGRPAVDVLADLPGMDMASAKRAITANGGRPDMTAGQFATMWQQRFDAAGGHASQGVLDETGPVSFQKTNTWVDMLRPDQIMAARRSAQQQLQQDQNRQQALAAKQQADNWAGVTVGIGRGEVSYSDLNDMRASGAINPQQWSEGTRALDETAKKQQGAADLMARAAAAGNGGPPLDPKNGDDRKALNLLYDATAQGWANLDPQKQLDMAVSFAAQKGMVPERLQAVVRGGLRSGSPDQVALAADTIARLRSTNPSLLNDFSEEDIRLGNTVGSLTAAGVPPAQAITLATDALKVGKATADARDSDYDAQRGKDVTARAQSDKAWLAQKVGGGWFARQFEAAVPDFSPEMQGEFNTIARTEFQRTGDLDAARTTAFDMMQRVWGQTAVGGAPRWMKYAPENPQLYGVPTMAPADNAKWMNEQLVADVTKGALTDPNHPITADRLLVLPDPTRTAPDGRPVYRVSVRGQDGVFYAVTDEKGQPVSWAPDWSSSAEKQRQDAAQQKLVDQARAVRERNKTSTPLGRALASPTLPTGVLMEFGGGLGLPH